MRYNKPVSGVIEGRILIVGLIEWGWVRSMSEWQKRKYMSSNDSANVYMLTFSIIQ